MAAKGDSRIKSATFFATQVDFTHAGDLKVFVDEEQLAGLEARMREHGYLEGQKMATAFNMLRSNDLIWPYVVNNYLRGKAPFPFDLLYWNSDATRMPAANHSFYLRNCYLNNALTKGEMTVADVTLDLKKVKVPVYNLATREDHIAPAKSVMLGSKFFGGPVRYVLSGSGHIAGVVNPVAKGKYQYWTGPKPTGSDVEAWLKKAKEHPGSWWPDWLEWIKGAGRRDGAGARTGRRQAHADRGRARQLREGALVKSRRCDQPNSTTLPAGRTIAGMHGPRYDPTRFGIRTGGDCAGRHDGATIEGIVLADDDLHPDRV